MEDEEAKHERLKAMTDDQLIVPFVHGSTSGLMRHEAEMERWRRLVTELRDLQETMQGFRRSADGSARWMAVLSIVIAFLTVVLVVLTAKLAVG